MKILSLLLPALLLMGCATSKHRWAQDLTEEVPQEKVLDIPFLAQEKNMCGPVVLKMATNFSAPEYTLSDLKEMTFREEVQGTFQSDILSAARRMGLTPYRVPSSSAMWSQIRDGRPVIVFQNLGVSWLPAWHFSLLVGYDSVKDKVYLHTGTEALQSIGIKRFQKTWERGGSWSYVVTAPADIPANASFEEALQNAMLLEKIDQQKPAAEVYQQMIVKFPTRFEPHLGLAQIYYAQGNKKAALKESETALTKSPGHIALLFNLSILYFENGALEKARELKRETLAHASPEERAAYENRFTF
ncbi:hypothetical protein AZI86_00310 [Bdellovibrio bacteriovorus]|uniref:Peptidase C39-like domain-containing protein n=1 Tax=Bdellovibrio bacteriovorus TaxID=959 RepID=A0A150WME3_BDEBC|nr:PA2778 family cysteine peptidase [Bdellovibrio bacteriovorus]KYG65558.1 hypothetical protein AZI86_00310 [Bdellovibrio bacteriovorus]